MPEPHSMMTQGLNNVPFSSFAASKMLSSTKTNNISVNDRNNALGFGVFLVESMPNMLLLL